MTCKNKGPLGPIRSRRLWNDPKTAVDEYLQGFAIMHPGIIISEGTRAVLRKDHAQMNDKVKLISGGGAGNEPTHAGFVGPGMLTGVIVGDIFAAPSSDSILRLIEELGTNHSPGVLIIVQNYTGYCINFGLAKSRAQNKGLLVAMLTVGDDTCSKSLTNTAGRRGLAGTLFILKIAGAMAEEGKRLEEICTVCNRIMNSAGGIVSIGLCTRIPLAAGTCVCTQSPGAEQMELGSGIHGEPGMRRVCFTTAKEIVSQLIDLMTDENSVTCLKLANCDVTDKAGDKVALIVNNMGGSSQIELGIFTKEVVQQLTSCGFCVKRLYVGTLMTTLDTSGFQFSILKLSSDQNITKYLDAPTAAPAWPKVLDVIALDPNSNGPSVDIEMTTFQRGSKASSKSGIPDIEPCGPVLDDRTAQVFLIIITFACEALITCTEKLNIMDEDSGDGDCGTSLSLGANAIRAAIKEKQIFASRPFVTLRQISYVIERVMGGIMGGLYSLFFEAGAKEFGKLSEQDPVDAYMWLNALAAGNKAIIEYGQANVGDRTMLDPLLTAQDQLAKALKMNLDPIRAFGDGVKAAESRIIETIKMPARVGRASLIECKQFEYPDPGAHAVGIWMRAAYEGVKLKLSCQFEDKR